MQATLKRVWEMLDYSQSGNSRKVNVEPGTYELERIPNPSGYEGSWLVIKGTTIGQSEAAWRQWKNGVLIDNPGQPSHGQPVDWGEYEIFIQE